jgi:hypothetical protein
MGVESLSKRTEALTGLYGVGWWEHGGFRGGTWPNMHGEPLRAFCAFSSIGDPAGVGLVVEHGAHVVESVTSAGSTDADLPGQCRTGAVLAGVPARPMTSSEQ